MFVWNVEDLGSEVYLHAGLSIAGALSLPARAHGEEVGPGLEAQKAILEVVRQARAWARLKSPLT